MRAMGRTIGIDLGTTNTVVAACVGGQPRILNNRFESRVTPSIVRLLPDGTSEVGMLAQRGQAADPKNTITGIKRFIGRYYNEVIDLREIVSFLVAPGRGGSAVVRAHSREYAPEEIAAMVLREVKASAEQQLREPVSDAVITVPAHFSQAQRDATRQAGELAGLRVRRLVVEPTAAALGYAAGLMNDQNVVVIDLGGGTFDVSVLDVGDQICQTISVAGDTNLGGDDFDDALLRWVVDEIYAERGLDLAASPSALAYVRQLVIAAKCELSFLTETRLTVPQMSPGDLPIELPITRGQFDHVADELFARLEEPIHRALRDARKKATAIDRVLLVGGASRMPGVVALARRIFGTRPIYYLNLEEAVALGAGIQAGVLAGDRRDIILLDATDASLSIEVDKELALLMIPRNTTIPTTRTEIFSTTRDDQTSVEVHLLRGEQLRAIDNRTLLRVKLDGISAAQKGSPRIEVRLEIDANHQINLTVKDRASGRSVTSGIVRW